MPGEREEERTTHRTAWDAGTSVLTFVPRSNSKCSLRGAVVSLASIIIAFEAWAARRSRKRTERRAASALKRGCRMSASGTPLPGGWATAAPLNSLHHPSQHSLRPPWPLCVSIGASLVPGKLAAAGSWRRRPLSLWSRRQPLSGGTSAR